MQTKDAIRSTMNMCDMVLKGYISDFEDGELLNRPTADCNSIAWQVGHLIASEVQLLKMIAPDSDTELPEGFAETHHKDNASGEATGKFCSRDEYLELMGKVRATTLAVLDRCSDEELDKPAPEQFQPWCPTIGDLFILIGTHGMMHAGQVVPVRRALGKPVMF